MTGSIPGSSTKEDVARRTILRYPRRPTTRTVKKWLLVQSAHDVAGRFVGTVKAGLAQLLLNRLHLLVLADVGRDVKAVREIVLQEPLHLLLDLVDPVVVVLHTATVSPWLTAKPAVELTARPIRT